MNKLIIAAGLLACSAGMAQADNLLQVLPQQLEPGCASTDQVEYTFAIQMVNDRPFIAMQFDLTLPPGVSLDAYDPIALSTDRFPFTTGRGGVKVFDHEVDYQGYGDGHYTVIITGKASGTTQPVIKGESGDLLYVYYVTDADMPSGILPIKISNVKLAASVTDGEFPADASCYFYSADFDPATAATLDFSALDGSMPVDVAAATNALVGANAAATELRLDNLAAIGEPIAVANPNCLTWVKGSTAAAAAYNGNANVVAMGEGGASCAKLELTDAMPFCASEAFTAASVAYKRNFPSAAWQALYLPFEVSQAELAGFGSAAVCTGMAVDAGGAVSLDFDELGAGSLAANTPAIVRSAAQGEAVLECAGKEIVPVADNTGLAFEADGSKCAMAGVYTVKADMYTSRCYGLCDGNFMRPQSQEVTLSPFRIFLSMGDKTAPDYVSVRIGGEAGTEGIEASPVAAPAYYDMHGRRVEVPAAGIYVTDDGKKLIVK